MRSHSLKGYMVHHCTKLLPGEKVQLMKLWNKEYPEQLAFGTMDNLSDYLEHLENPRHHLYFKEGILRAWFCTFQREHATWFAMIIASGCQGRGLGSQLLTTAVNQNPELHGWAVPHDNYNTLDGLPYHSPLGFYKKIGFEIKDAIKLKLAPIDAVKIEWRSNQ